jgi:hypothetical protein
MNVFAFSTSPTSDWRWRIVDLKGETGVLRELPDDRASHRGGDGKSTTPQRPRSSASAGSVLASPRLIEGVDGNQYSGFRVA